MCEWVCVLGLVDDRVIRSSKIRLLDHLDRYPRAEG